MTSLNFAQLRTLSRLAHQSADPPLQFHDWPHVEFVTEMALSVCEELGAEARYVEAASLVHDLNHVLKPGSKVAAGNLERLRVLAKAGASNVEARRIVRIVEDAATSNRHEQISPEAMALSDGDTLVKALPTTPILMATLFMAETGRSIEQLAGAIAGTQRALMDDGLYFYAQSMDKKYTGWAETNIQLWESVLEALADPRLVPFLQEQIHAALCTKN